jgi:hypothetical protein
VGPRVDALGACAPPAVVPNPGNRVVLNSGNQVVPNSGNRVVLNRRNFAPFTERDFRDDEGRLCRQAARFRIYREDPSGAEEITLETPGIASITWTAHVANKKASWYTFVTNEGENGYAPNHPLRNASVADRHTLMI